MQARLQPMTAAKKGAPRAEKRAGSRCLPVAVPFPECDFISPVQVRVGTFSLFWVGSANHDAIEPGRHSVY